MKRIAIALLSLISVMLVGCVRDEARPVAEILADSKSRYESIDKTKVPTVAREKLGGVSKALEALLAGENSALEIAMGLESLTGLAGYTARPAFGELSKQYRAVASNGTKGATTKLLAARTFSLLESELKTTAFRIS